MANVPPRRELYSKILGSTHSQMCSSRESAYQALHAEFLAKSRHNDIPDSPIARARLRALIDKTQKDLRFCSENITRCKISRVLELQKSLLAPIRILPSDVLTDIFELVIETSPNPGITYTYQNPTKLSGCIFIFTWICFWWRQEAVSYSTFWSRIAFYDSVGSHPAQLPTAGVGALLTECILRSGVLHIKIFMESATVCPSFITMLVARAHRWRQAALSFNSLQQIDSVFPFEPSSTHFPLLEDLSFNLKSNEACDITNRILVGCHPPLRKLELPELSESSIDVIAGQKLKILKVGCYSGVSLARLLHMCPCLEFLTLQSFKVSGNPGTNQIACQASLLTLDIGGDVHNEAKIENGAWIGVTLPKLSKLEVTLPDLIDEENWEAAYEPDTSLSELKEVVKQSKCTLRCVNLIMYAKDYGQEPRFTLETVDKFFEDLLVKVEGSFMEDKLLLEWKEDMEETIKQRERPGY